SIPSTFPTRAANPRISQCGSTRVTNPCARVHNLGPVQWLCGIAQSPNPTVATTRKPALDFVAHFGSVDRAPLLFSSRASYLDNRRWCRNGFRTRYERANCLDPLERPFQIRALLLPTSRPRHSSPPAQHVPGPVWGRFPALFAHSYSTARSWCSPRQHHSPEPQNSIPLIPDRRAHNWDLSQSPAQKAVSIFAATPRCACPTHISPAGKSGRLRDRPSRRDSSWLSLHPSAALSADLRFHSQCPSAT